MLALAGVMGLGMSQAGWAANHQISAQQVTFDCSRAKPGDTVTIPGGTRGPLKIAGCKGTASNPIVVRNDPDASGPAVIRRSSGSSGGFVFSCNHCQYTEIDGSYKWKGAPGGRTYGIQVTMSGGRGPSAFVKIGGLSKKITIRNVEVDGRWPQLADNGIGIDVNDHSYKRSKYPGLWREGILIEDNYVHDVEGEGMYIGANYGSGDIPLRDVEIRYNRVEDTGWDGINTKSMWQGDNSIHHNVVLGAGKNGARSKSSQFSGIKNISGKVDIYNNWVEETGQHGIQVWTQEGPKASENRGPFPVRIWNNVIVDAGKLWRSFMAKAYGIGVGAQSGVEKPVPYVYNNTIVRARHGSVNVGSNVGGGLVRDNIAAGSGGNPAISVARIIDLLNNVVGPVSTMGFVDPDRGNYRLRLNSPALDKGSNGFPPTDFDDVKRPKGGAPDQGAFEGS
jgi:hypothetical protein